MNDDIERLQRIRATYGRQARIPETGSLGDDIRFLLRLLDVYFGHVADPPAPPHEHRWWSWDGRDYCQETGCTVSRPTPTCPHGLYPDRCEPCGGESPNASTTEPGHEEWRRADRARVHAEHRQEVPPPFPVPENTEPGRTPPLPRPLAPLAFGPHPMPVKR